MQKPYAVLSPSALSEALYACEDRDLFFKSQEFKKVFSEIAEEIYKANNRLIFSCDVFDTVLLRNEKSEPYRFFEIAHQIKEMLLLPHNVYEVLLARYLGTEITYAASKIEQGCREGSLFDIHKIMLEILGLEKSLLKKTIEIEVEYEKNNLVLNSGLWNVMLEFVSKYDAKIILVSDMYKHATEISKLLEHHIPDYRNVVKKLYSSADTIISKHSGKIFSFIEQDLNEKPSVLFHMGDNLRSDYLNPKKAKWNALYLPIPKYLQERIRDNLISFKNQLDKDNVRIDLVDRFFVEKQ